MALTASMALREPMGLTVLREPTVLTVLTARMALTVLTAPPEPMVLTGLTARMARPAPTERQDPQDRRDRRPLTRLALSTRQPRAVAQAVMPSVRSFALTTPLA